MIVFGICQRVFERSRLDVAAWTTTGIVRTGNEDAFAVLHAAESREDYLFEYALILLADGMGGYEAGEIAAAMALQSLRSYLLEQPMFAALAGKEPPQDTEFDVEECKTVLDAALKHANKTVYTASRTPGKGRRGMGCTAEAVYVDGRNIVVGHVEVPHTRRGQLQSFDVPAPRLDVRLQPGVRDQRRAAAEPPCRSTFIRFTQSPQGPSTSVSRTSEARAE